MFRIFITMFVALVCTLSYAAPAKIIIVRHGDKLPQSNTGPTLSVKGEVRAVNFAMYFLKKFGEPDFVFATNPSKDSSSIRELQTVAPLVNIMQEKHPEFSIDIYHPYSSSDYGKLAKQIMNSADYDNKVILICWSHGKIPGLAHALGVAQKLDKWPSDDYDSVYVLQYNHNGDIKDFEILHQQYPVKFNGNWDDLQSIMMGRG